MNTAHWRKNEFPPSASTKRKLAVQAHLRELAGSGSGHYPEETQDRQSLGSKSVKRAAQGQTEE